MDNLGQLIINNNNENDNDGNEKDGNDKHDQTDEIMGQQDENGPIPVAYYNHTAGSMNVQMNKCIKQQRRTDSYPTLHTSLSSDSNYSPYSKTGKDSVHNYTI